MPLRDGKKGQRRNKRAGAAVARADSRHAHPGQGRLRHPRAACPGRSRHAADGRVLAGEQGLPPRFLGAILADLRRAGIVASQRGAEGGYRLAREPDAITIADVIRALDGPLAEVRGFRPEATNYDGAAEHLQQVWVAVRASLRSVLEKVTLTDVISGHAPVTRAEDGDRPRCLGRPLTPSGRAHTRWRSRRATTCGSCDLALDSHGGHRRGARRRPGQPPARLPRGQLAVRHPDALPRRPGVLGRGHGRRPSDRARPGRRVHRERAGGAVAASRTAEARRRLADDLAGSRPVGRADERAPRPRRRRRPTRRRRAPSCSMSWRSSSSISDRWRSPATR